MSKYSAIHKEQGFSFVELLIVAAIISLVFGGLFAAVQGMMQVISGSKAKAGAVALANERIEYIRSLPYNQVGTIGAPPYGNIPESRNVTLNDIMYFERVLVRNVDDPADGVGYGGDSNGVIEDYKIVEIEYGWVGKNGTSTYTLSSYVVPVGIETSAGGGSLRVNVFDANTQPVYDAAVTVVNDTLATTTNTTQYTNVDGELLISGLPAGANYSIWTTKFGYSGDGTYEATTSNPNPTTLPIAIAEGAVSTMNFQIDELSDLTVRTMQAPVANEFSDDFTTAGYVDIFASTTHATDQIELVDGGGFYYQQGTTTSTSTSPSSLDSWYALSFNTAVSASTSVTVYVYYENGGLSLVPDVDLPGNSSGFTSGPVNLQGLNVAVYDTLVLVAELSTVDGNYTPALLDWTLSYIESQSAISGVPIQVQGYKTIGTDGGGAPIYKFSDSYTTDGSGNAVLQNIEYDLYSIWSGGGYDVLEVCPLSPHNLEPDQNDTIEFILGSLAGSFLRVTAVDAGGDVVPNASVRLENAGYDVTQSASLCGQTYFNGGGLYNDGGYTLTVSASGYITEVVTPVLVNQNASTTVVLSSS